LGEYESIDLDRNHMHVMCTIQAPVAKIERAPIDLVCVVDKSGSMAGEKLKLVKEACSFIVQELQDGDHFCLISYDDRIDVEFDIAEMKKKNKENVLGIIDKLNVRGSTNLCGGLYMGIDCANKSKSGNSVSSIWLFTDGLANIGIVDTPSIVKGMVDKLKKQTKTVFTFGFGSNHKADMLTEIADKGSGMYYYIEGSKDIGPSFADCLGGVLSVYAQDISLSIEPTDNCKIIKVLGVVKKKRKTEVSKKKQFNGTKQTSDSEESSKDKKEVKKEEEKKEKIKESKKKEKKKKRRKNQVMKKTQRIKQKRIKKK